MIPCSAGGHCFYFHKGQVNDMTTQQFVLMLLIIVILGSNILANIEAGKDR